MSLRAYTPVATIDITPLWFNSPGTSVIHVYPWVRESESDPAPRSPELVIPTATGELRFSYSPSRKRFSVVSGDLHFSGMPAGITLNASRDEAAFSGFEISELDNLDRIPKWGPTGYEARSDKRDVTRVMSRKVQDHLEYVTSQVGKMGAFRALIDATEQWSARRRLYEVRAELDSLQAEYDSLLSQVAGDSLPVPV